MTIYKHFMTCLFFTTILCGQTSQKQIQLLDRSNQTPVSRVVFQYDTQEGFSDLNGIIQLTISHGNDLKLSHIGYEPKTISAEIIQDGSDKVTIYLDLSSIELYPSSIILIRDVSKAPKSKIRFGTQESLQHDTGSILKSTPLFGGIQKGGRYGLDPVFRGFKYEQLNVVLNGVQHVSAACPNRMDPPTSQMPSNMLSKIEILKGPYALRYGVGLGATLNFISSKPTFTDVTNLNGRFSTAYETNGEVKRTEMKIGRSNQRLNYNLFGSLSQGEDYDDGNGKETPADFSRNSYGFSLALKLKEKHFLESSVFYNRARDVDFPALPMDLREDNTWMFNLKYEYQPKGGSFQGVTTHIYASLVDHLMDNIRKPLKTRMLNAKTKAETFNFGYRTEGVWKFDTEKLYLGSDFRTEKAKGNRTRSYLMGTHKGVSFSDNSWQDSKINQVSLFSEYHLKSGPYDFVFSGRLTLNHAESKDPDITFISQYGNGNVTQFNPSFSMGLMKYLKNSTRFSLWLGRVQRSAGLTERFINFFPVGLDPYEMLGNPDLKPEINNQIDLSLKKYQDKSAWDISVYLSYLNNYISSVIRSDLDPLLPKSPGVRQFINIDQAFKTGFELSWSQELFDGLNQSISMGYTYAEDLENEEPLPEIAPFEFNATLSGSYLNQRFFPVISFRQVAGQGRISKAFGETATPSFNVLSFTSKYLVNEKLELGFGIENLLDNTYYEHLNRSTQQTNSPIMAMGRNLWINMSYVF